MIKALKILTIISPLLIIILYLELLSIDNYYEDRIGVNEIIVKKSKLSPKMEAAELNKLHQEGLDIMRSKLEVEILMIALALFLVIRTIFYFRKSWITSRSELLESHKVSRKRTL